MRSAAEVIVTPVSGNRILAGVALIAGLALLIATIATPTCRNYRGTARDSGYPCKLNRSSVATQFLFSAESRVSIPRGELLGLGLLALGGWIWARRTPNHRAGR